MFFHDVVTNARLQHLGSPGPAYPGAAFVGGFVPTDASHEKLRQARDRVPVDAFQDGVSHDFTLDGTFLYGGLIYGHLGHVMCEIVHRILTVRSQFRECPWLFVGLGAAAPLLGLSSMPPALKQALGFLDVAPENVLCVHAHSRIKRLQIPEQGSDFGGGPKPGCLALLRAHAEARLDSLYRHGAHQRRIYVSRTRLPPGGSFLGETYLETLLEQEGCLPFHPEMHALEWQMETYRRAEVVIFPEGSACHGVELLGVEMLQTCAFLERRPSHRRVFENVLAPRAQTMHRLLDSPMLGTLAAHPVSGEPLEHAGVWVFSPQDLLSFMRGSGLADLPGFQVDQYRLACRTDLDAYILRYRQPGAAAVPEQGFTELQAAFDLAMAGMT